MLRTVLYITAAVLCAVLAPGQEATDQPPIPMAELNQRLVIGELGVPLGTVVEVEVVVVSGRELRRKADSSSYLLKITHVDRKPLHEPRVMRFTVPGFVHVDLANDNFALHKLKHGEETSRLDSDRIKTLEEGYVGKKYRLAVYEVGAFTGIPTNMPEDAPGWQDVGFGFRTSLIVLADRDPLAEADDNK